MRFKAVARDNGRREAHVLIGRRSVVRGKSPLFFEEKGRSGRGRRGLCRTSGYVVRECQRRADDETECHHCSTTSWQRHKASCTCGPFIFQFRSILASSPRRGRRKLARGERAKR